MIFDTILLTHLRRYPLMQPADVYKLLHQACLGSEHAVDDPQRARQWLEHELATMGPGPDEPLCDPIAPDGSLLRLHLRPFLANSGDPEQLLQAFVRTANYFHGKTAALEQALTLAATGELPFDASALQQLGEEMKARAYPAMHHSPTYQAAYRPAYRVLSAQEARFLQIL